MKLNTPTLLIASSVVLAGGAGFLAAGGVSALTQAPSKTVTINVGQGTQGPKGDTGPAGPPGPKGDPGSPGAESCIAGSTFGALVINHPGGQTTIYTCIKD